MNTRFNDTFSRALKRFGTLGAYFNAMIKVKLGRPLLNLFISTGRVVGGSISRSTVLVIITYVAHCSRLARKSGIRFLVIYLKAQYVNLMQAVAKCSFDDIGPLGCRFARTGRHLPRSIPVLHRAWIRKGSVFHIRLWTSLFSFYRVLEFTGKVKLNSIVDPGVLDFRLVAAYSDFVSRSFNPALNKYFKTPWLELIRYDKLEAVKQLRLVPFQILSVSSSLAKLASTSPRGVVSALLAWKDHPLLPFFKDWLKGTANTGFLNWFEKSLATSDLHNWKVGRGDLGRLAYLPEPAGKVRVVAIVDCFTQWAFQPLHKEIFEILRLIPQDGTFDQDKPLKHLGVLAQSGESLFSFDLSAATDRLPVILQATQLSTFIGSHFANLWINLLVSRDYVLPEDILKDGVMVKKSVRYAVGQPMGALTSWAMLAIHHHSLVQWAAVGSKVIKEGEWFTNYAVLGDDVVIANEKVAKAYQELIEALEVQIGLHKSLVSRGTGAFEFAKRFIVKGVSCTPVPLLEVLASMKSIPAMLELGKKYSLGLSTLASISGFGYRAIGGMNRYIFSIGRRMRNLILSYVGPSGIESLTLLEFLAFRGLGRSPVGLTDEERQSLFDKIKDDILRKLNSWEPRIAVIKRLIEVRRDSAHYRDRSSYSDKQTLSPFVINNNDWFRTLLDPDLGRGLRQPRINNPEMPNSYFYEDRDTALAEMVIHRFFNPVLNPIQEPRKVSTKQERLIWIVHGYVFLRGSEVVVVPPHEYTNDPMNGTVYYSMEAIEEMLKEEASQPEVGPLPTSLDAVPTLCSVEMLQAYLETEFTDELTFFDYVLFWDRIWYEGQGKPEQALVEQMFINLTLEFKPAKVWKVLEPFLTGKESTRQKVYPDQYQANPNQSVWALSLLEYVYREFYKDVPSKWRKLLTTVEDLTYTVSPEEFVNLLDEINLLEEEIKEVSLIPSSDKAHPSESKLSPLSIWIRRWNRLIKSTHRSSS